MNGFNLMADSIRKVDGNEKKAKVYDYLATCDQDDIYTLFDSTAFNEVSKQYLRVALKRLTDSGTITEEQATAVRNEVARLYEDKTAREIMEQ